MCQQSLYKYHLPSWAGLSPERGLSSSSCKASCAGVSCGLNEVCKDGTCVSSCGASCSTLQVCDTSTQKCVTNQCLASGKTCATNQCCDPFTGACGPCPCDGVVCPKGQSCSNGQCVGNTSSSAGGANSTGDAGISGNQNLAGSATVTNTLPDRRAFGRPTGGGGCGCRVVRGSHTSQAMGMVAAGLAIALWRRRRRKAARSNEIGGAP